MHFFSVMEDAISALTNLPRFLNLDSYCKFARLADFYSLLLNNDICANDSECLTLRIMLDVRDNISYSIIKAASLPEENLAQIDMISFTNVFRTVMSLLDADCEVTLKMYRMLRYILSKTKYANNEELNDLLNRDMLML